MASAVANGSTAAIGRRASDCESFGRFFEQWLCEQNNKLRELISASHYHHNYNSIRQTPDRDDTKLTQLINRVISHYELYYRSKSRWAHHDVLSVLTPAWKTTLEAAFLWIGGWRPSMAFHLLYSKSGLQFESQVTDLIFGLGNGDLADLSTTQVNQINELQARTLREEKKITGKMAKRQVKVADKLTVELSHTATEMSQNSGVLEEGRVEDTLEGKVDGLEEVLKKADELRLKTLKCVLEILTPIQAVHFLIAAAELHLRIHDWGMQKDAKIGGHVEMVMPDKK